MKPFLSIWAILLFVGGIFATIHHFNGIDGNESLKVAWKNSGILNNTLNRMKPGDELIFPAKRTYYLVGGILVKNLLDVIIRFEGTLVFTNNTDTWPKTTAGRVMECLQFDNVRNVTFTSSSIGILDGQGEAWWGLIGYLEYKENRPRMLNIGGSKDVLVENLLFKNSPYWTVWIHEVDGLEIRNSEISNRRDDYDGHDYYNLEAFNTDGFDVSGKNVWIHDCKVWNQDDSVCVKDNSENMLIERVHASGLGLTIGSIGNSAVRNITFRDCYMHKTYKGIYMKFRGSGLIKNITYENITMYKPEQWPIWIGPAQQADSINICAAHPCSLCWPDIPFAECNMPLNASYVDITLRNIRVINPLDSSGVLMGSKSNPIQNLIFDRVVFENPMGNYYVCENVKGGFAKGGTFPVPPCFNKQS